MLIGTYEHTIDDKGRLIIPAKLRCDVGDSFVMCKGMEGCLFLYSASGWDQFSGQIDSLSYINKDARNFKRFFIGSACECVFDKQGRALIPPYLRRYANLTKNVIIVGMRSRIEIWDQDSWEKKNSLSEAELEETAKRLEAAGIRI